MRGGSRNGAVWNSREKKIVGVSACKTKGQRRIKSIADKAAEQDAGAHLVSFVNGRSL